MPIYQKILLELLSQKNSLGSKNNQNDFRTRVRAELEPLTEKDLAAFYVDCAYLQALLAFLREQHWLVQKKTGTAVDLFSSFVDSFAQGELASRPYLSGYLRAASLDQIKGFEALARVLELESLNLVTSKDFFSQGAFSKEALSNIAVLFERENQLLAENERQGTHLGLSLYRTFDGLDQVFNFNYLADQGMKTDLLNTERLYEGAGVGVQSGYSTILTGLHCLKAKNGARFVDLGSGYGRLGIVIGLLRPDIEFIGYEFVPHRVQLAQEIAHNFGIHEKVRFITQDLAARDFEIPAADIYYLYDPFCDATYHHVLEQLVQISRRQTISVVTKGNARGWLLALADREGWPKPKEFHAGNLCVFTSVMAEA